MDVILAQLGARELESHCRDAMKTQLDVMQSALNEAVGAAKRAEEVQLASQKLAISLFEEGSELSAALFVSTWLRDELAQSIERVMARVLGASDGEIRAAQAKSTSTPLVTASTNQKADSTPQKKRKVSAQTADETSAKKPKCSPSITSEHASETPAKSSDATKKPKSTTALIKALATCTNLTEELAKKKKVVNRVSGLKTLVQHFNTAQKNLDRNSIVDQIEALDTLSVVAGMAISIMQHGKPQMKRHWVQKFRDNIADIQEEFPDSAAAFNGYKNSLSKIISGFPLTIKEGQQLRMRLRKALEDVKGWKDGQYTIADATQKISLVAEALESTCPNWSPQADKTVRELTALLLARVSLFKDNKKQAKRKRQLQSWLDKLDQGPQEPPSTTRSPLASDANTKSRKAPKSLEKKQATPGKANGKSTTPTMTKTPRKRSPHLPQAQVNQSRPSITELSASSTESSDTEPTQPRSCIKVEVSE